MSNKQTSITINEHLSALLDDEAGTFENRRVLNELKTDQKLAQKLSSYALIGETMRTGNAERPALSLGSNFLDGIHEKIAEEDEFNQVLVDSEFKTNKETVDNDAANSSSWLRPIGGFAVAASVGALAFMGLQNMGILGNQQLQPDGLANSSAPTAIVQAASVNKPNPVNADNLIATTNATDADQYVDADAQTRSMLKRYVDSHMQYATASTFVPSVRVIAYTDHQ